MLSRRWLGYGLYLLLVMSVTTLRAATSGSTVIGPITSPVMQNIFLLDSGYVNWPTVTTTPQQSFVTNNRKCPATHRPFVAISMSKILSTSILSVTTSPFHSISGFGVCVNGLTTNANNYTVQYLVTKRYNVAAAQITQNVYTGSSIFTVSSSILISGFGRNTKPTAHQASNQPNYTSVGGLKWFVYCYPNSLALPYDQSVAASVNAIGCYGLNLPLGNLGVPF